MTWLNLSGTLNAFRLFRDPSLCLPHHTVSTFNNLPIPLSKAIPGSDIRAVILDKDNCFAVPHQKEVYEGYKEKFAELKKAYPGSRLLIVSNTAGTSSDKRYLQAAEVEQNTGIAVLRHDVKKPGCHEDIMSYLRRSDIGVTSPSQVAIVGDRLLTDMMLANVMGSYGFWVKDGVAESGKPPSFVCIAQSPLMASLVLMGQIARTEARMAVWLLKKGLAPQDPTSEFEK